MLLEKPCDELLPAAVRVVLGELQGTFLDLLIDAHWVVRVAPIGQYPADHLIEDDSQAPDID